MCNIKFLMLSLMLISTLSHSSTENSNAVEFISNTPIIDGKLDENLTHLLVRKFKHFWDFDNPKTEASVVSYRMAYTPTHLYVYIETDANSISYHRRGYLWGDGYKILLGIPQIDSLTNEYYELSYSPSKDKNYWDRQSIAVYNFSQVQKKLSPSSQSLEFANKGQSGFEALIAWSDIEPYHPWFLDKIGFNLYFAKGIESKQHGYFTHGYAVVEDEGIWDEEIAMRNTKTISFAQPMSVEKAVIFVKPNKNNLQTGEFLSLAVVTLGNKTKTEKVKVTLTDSKSKTVLNKQLTVGFEKSLQKKNYTINSAKLKTGKYKITIQTKNDSFINSDIVIHPIINFQKLSNSIQGNENFLSIGTVNTLQFELKQIENKLTHLKAYETGENILIDWKSFQNKYKQFIVGVDPYSKLTEPYRRAFKSKYDNSYQPYSIKLPKDYSLLKNYPLLVFLHGSGQDEQSILKRKRSGGNFIEIAPFARDLYRAYSSGQSQNDIVEAIDDVSKYFPVNKKNIIIGGFSMGGYGALRTFYQHPNLYKGIAVFAGHPNLASVWLDEKHPNFLEDKYLTHFKGIPVFVYHGKKDAGLDVKLIESMIIKLNKAGAKVTQSIVENKGHEYPDVKTNFLYFNWLNKTTQQD